MSGSDETAGRAAGDAIWDPAPTLSEIERLRHDILTAEDLAPEARNHLLDALAELEREALHPERDPQRIRRSAQALEAAHDRHAPGLVEAIGPNRLAALTGLLPHV